MKCALTLSRIRLLKSSMGGNKKHGKFDKKRNPKRSGEDEGNETDEKHGRIGRLDENTLGYYRRVSDSLNNDFESAEDKGSNSNTALPVP